MEKNMITKDWTKKEAGMLIRLWMKTESISLVAILMNRTTSSIQTRALRLELPARELEDSFRRRWTEKEDQRIQQITKETNVDIFQLSKDMKRTIDAIINRMMTKHHLTLDAVSKIIILPDAEAIYNDGAITTTGQASERNRAKCMKPFWSEGFGRRVCLACKSTEDWQDGEY